MLQWDRDKHIETVEITGLFNSLARDSVCKYTIKDA